MRIRPFVFLAAAALARFSTACWGADQALLFCYFVGNGEDGLHLARSENGLDWRALGGGRSFLKPQVGESRIMRDPCILRGPDGIFRMVWSDSWWGKTIGYSSSPDLLHWSPQVAIPVMYREPKAENSWAPEAVYDAQRGQYVIFWATSIPGRFPATDATGHLGSDGKRLDHRIYGTVTGDFASFGPTRLLYDGGFDAIDATMAPDGTGRWLLFVKDETEHPKAEKNIRLVRAETPWGPFSKPSAPITGRYWAEGPTAIRISGAWYVYFDRYREHRFGVVRSDDLEHWKDLSDSLHMPAGVRHGTVFSVPSAIADALR